MDLNDTLNNRQTMQTLAAAQVSYETQERARRLRQLTLQQQEQGWRNRLLVGAVAVLAIGLLVTAYLYRNLRRSRAGPGGQQPRPGKSLGRAAGRGRVQRQALRHCGPRPARPGHGLCRRYQPD